MKLNRNANLRAYSAAALAAAAFAQPAQAQVMISQLNATGATQRSWAGPTAEYVEIHNAGASSVDLTGWAIQTTNSATGTTWFVRPFPAGFTVQAGRYALMQFGTAGTPLNSPNNPDDVYGFVPAADIFASANPILSSLGGKVALTTSQVALIGSCPLSDPSVVDFLGYGGANCSEGGVAPSMSNFDGRSLYRGCTGSIDTNNNSTDFIAVLSSPRNLLSPPNLGAMTAVGAPAPGAAISVAQNSAVLLTATASSCSGAPSGVSFAANLSFVGGPAVQPMFDDGTHGDAAAGDGVFSFSYIVPDTLLPAPAPGPTINRPYVVPMTGTDSLGRNAAAFASFFVTAAPTGACCIPGQGVSVQTQGGCLAAGGSYQGDNSSPFPTQGTMYYSALSAIPDPGSASTSIEVPDPTTVNEVVVHIWAAHNYLGDVSCTLTRGTTTVDLFRRVGVAGNNATGRPGNLASTSDYRFFERGASFWSAAYNGGKDTNYNEPEGFYAPSGPGNAPSSLAPFIGGSAQGTWTLTMTDSNLSEAGSFSWAIEINPISLCPAACYANCDDSTATPQLTANDFVCFLNAYSTAEPYANCDGSTGTPLLTANDFTCFVNRYAQGCS
jgi:subtilisin-like proprotein convertase family protein